MWNGMFVYTGEGYRIYTLPNLVYVHCAPELDVPAEAIADVRRRVIEDARAGKDDFVVHGSVGSAEGFAALARFVAREKQVEVFRDFAQALVNQALSTLASLIETDREAALALLTDLGPLTGEFPDLKGELEKLRARLAGC
jgi:hypothetical protein